MWNAWKVRNEGNSGVYNFIRINPTVLVDPTHALKMSNYSKYIVLVQNYRYCNWSGALDDVEIIVELNQSFVQACFNIESAKSIPYTKLVKPVMSTDKDTYNIKDKN